MYFPRWERGSGVLQQIWGKLMQLSLASLPYFSMKIFSFKILFFGLYQYDNKAGKVLAFVIYTL